MLYPNESDVWTAIVGIFYKPYWQVYGELFLEEIDYDPSMLSSSRFTSQLPLPACVLQYSVFKTFLGVKMTS